MPSLGEAYLANSFGLKLKVMDEPVILLLEDFSADERTVNNILQILVEMRVLCVKRGNKNALDFFAEDEDPEPSIIIMYMDSPDMVSIEFAENAYLIQLEEYGLCKLEDQLECEVNPAGSLGTINLLHFFGSVSVSKGFISMIDN